MTLCTDECTCQSMVSWSFQQLDTDYDGHLSHRELVSLKSASDVMKSPSDVMKSPSDMMKSPSDVMNSACVSEFTSACDHDNDGALSEKEWCCCYADICESTYTC